MVVGNGDRVLARASGDYAIVINYNLDKVIKILQGLFLSLSLFMLLKFVRLI